MRKEMLQNGNYVEFDNKQNQFYYDSQGKLHREDGPAICYQNGELEYWVHGHSYCRAEYKEMSWPKEETYNGYRRTSWYDCEGVLHRNDGPAVQYHDPIHGYENSGNPLTQYYYKHGSKHREDGPAAVVNSGAVEYWIDGKRIMKSDFMAMPGASSMVLNLISECVDIALSLT